MVGCPTIRLRAKKRHAQYFIIIINNGNEVVNLQRNRYLYNPIELEKEKLYLFDINEKSP